MPPAPRLPSLPRPHRDDALLAVAGLAGGVLLWALGVAGYGGSRPLELLAAVRAVAAGDGVVDPAVTRRLLAEFARGGAGRERAVPEGLARLTPREREVLGRLGEGLGNAEIAERIGVAEGTVKSHVSRLLAKLELRNRLQASLLARDLGL